MSECTGKLPMLTNSNVRHPAAFTKNHFQPSQEFRNVNFGSAATSAAGSSV
jgi:hypothetical protein